VRSLKGLEDVIQLIVFDDAVHKDGKMLWCFKGEGRDPLYGYQYLKELYERSEEGYDGRYLVPTLWDKKTGTFITSLFQPAYRFLIQAQKKSSATNPARSSACSTPNSMP
jgi:glutathionyl-hydroquinone reductase